MKLQLGGIGLNKILGLTLGVVEKKSTIPVLSNLLIQPDSDNHIRITGTDLDVTSITRVEAISVAGTEAICVQGRKLHDVLKTFPNGTNFELEKTENHWVKLKAKNYNSKLAGVDGSNYPQVPTCSNQSVVTISCEQLQHLIELTSFAITMESSRFTLSGGKLMIKGETARLICTDGHRLSLAEVTLAEKAKFEIDCLIPKKALTEVLRHCRENDQENISIQVDENHIFFKIGKNELIARKLAGTFPNYETVIPKDCDKSFVVDAQVLRETINRVAQMADERTRAMKFTVENKRLTLSSQSAEEGEASDAIEIDYQGDKVEIGINSHYAIDVLTQVQAHQANSKSKNIVFNFRDGNWQLLWTMEDDTKTRLKYILMPLRV